MPVQDRRFLELERRRLTRYQHQHRGLDFLKLWLPPTTDKRVNIIGLNDHVYRGKVPREPLDELPTGVDEGDVDEEALYKEIKEMAYPSVPSQEALGPVRRIGGAYTKVQRQMFAPLVIHESEGRSEAKGQSYLGTQRQLAAYDFDGTIRSLRGNHSARPPSDREPVVPTTVTLQVRGTGRRSRESTVQIPLADLNRIINALQAEDAKSQVGEESALQNSETDEGEETGEEVDEELEEPETDEDIDKTEFPETGDDIAETGETSGGIHETGEAEVGEISEHETEESEERSEGKTEED